MKIDKTSSYFKLIFRLDEDATDKPSKKKSDRSRFKGIKTSTVVNNKQTLSPSTTIVSNEEESTTPKFVEGADVEADDLPKKVFYSEHFSTAIPQIRRRRHHRRK